MEATGGIKNDSSSSRVIETKADLGIITNDDTSTVPA